MPDYVAYAFADGGYLRKLADNAQRPWVDPRRLGETICSHNEVTTLGASRRSRAEAQLRRVVYYDAIADEDGDIPPHVLSYWQSVELLHDTHLGFGSLRGTKRGRPRQKGVDTLMAVDMVVGAFDRLFDVCLLIAGDADFVPVVREVQRRGGLVVIAASPESLADDLRRSCDRFVPIGPGQGEGWFPRLQSGLRFWDSGGERSTRST